MPPGPGTVAKGVAKKTHEALLLPLQWRWNRVTYASLAQMAELVDALASGASVRKDVEVQVLFWAPSLPRDR